MTKLIKVLLVGCGSMGSALYKGWLQKGGFEVVIIDPHVPEAFKSVKFLDKTYEPDVVFFAVKPQMIHEVIQDYISFASRTCAPVFISIMAGVPIATLEQLLTHSPLVVRAMPNLPALVGQGMTGVVAQNSLEPQVKLMVESIFSAVGHVVWLENEDQINAVTAISGSGPAYFFRLTETLSQAGISLGLSREIADHLARQTLIGAAEILKDSIDSAEQWRQKVTSPGGTTQAALKAFDQGGLSQLVEKAVTAAFHRSIELSKS